MNIKNPFQGAKKSISSSKNIAMPLFIAAFVGVVTGLLVVGFVEVLDWCEHFFFHTLKDSLGFLGIFALLAIPCIGGLIVGPIVTFLAPEAKGHGVPEVMKAMAVNGGRIRLRVVFAKVIASAIAIGSGASVGREGPIVQIGSALGSFIARIFRYTELRIKNLIACGAAAGIAGVFNTPIAGVMFALEVILRDFGARALSTVVVAAVSASIVSRIFLGESPAFIVPIYQLVSPLEIFLYFILGILSAFAAFFFITVLHKSEKTWDGWKFPNWLKPAVGGLLIGAIGIYLPEIFGSGLPAIEQALLGNMAVMTLLLLIVVKIVATSISLGSGSSGGVFAPALFIGAVLGGSFGHLVYGNMPFEVGPSGAYALVGMASVFAACAHAPVTAILIVFEMTSDYQMILPLMISTVVAVSISQILRKESIYTIKLVEKGINLESMEGTAFLGMMQVHEVMSQEYETVRRKMPAKELVERMSQEKHRVFYVVNKSDELTGVIHRKELHEALFEKDLEIFVADDLAHPIYEKCVGDDSLSDVAHLMSSRHLTQMPVVDPEHHKKVVGVLKSEDIFHAVTVTAEKRDALMSRVQPQSGEGVGAVQMRFQINSRSPIAGKALMEMTIPDGVVFISIQRKKKNLIPEGDTVLKPRDKVWAVVMPENEKEFIAWLRENEMETSDLFRL